MLIVFILGGIYFAFGKNSAWGALYPNKTQQDLSLPSPTNTTDWQIYENADYGIEFTYPQNLNIENSSKADGEIFIRLIDPKTGYQGEIEHFESPFYNPGPTADFKSITDQFKYEVYTEGNKEQFSNKIGSEFKVDNQPTLHLLTKNSQAGVYNEFYVNHNGKLLRILLDSNYGTWSNLDLQDGSTWQVKLLKSFKFTK